MNIRLKCNKTIGRTYSPSTNITIVIEKCDTQSLCKGILLPNCELENDSKKICEVYEVDTSSKQTSCFWMKSKLMFDTYS